MSNKIADKTKTKSDRGKKSPFKKQTPQNQA